VKWQRNYDQWYEEYISKTEKFVCCMFLGNGQYDKREATSISEARLIRRQMFREYGDTAYGRGILIYAVTHDGLSIPLKD